MTEKQLNKELERSKLIIEMQRNATVKYREEIATCNNNKLNISKKLFKCEEDLESNKQYYEQTLETIKNAPHACKGEWGWASDNIFCPIENQWKSASMEVKYAVIAGSVLAIATLGLAGYGAYAYFYAVPTANAAVVVANAAAAEAAAVAADAAANEANLKDAALVAILNEISPGSKKHYNKGGVTLKMLRALGDYIIGHTKEEALDYFNDNHCFDNNQRQYIGEIAHEVLDYFQE